MEKTKFVLDKIRAVKGHLKAKRNRLKFYSENSNRIEKLSWDHIKNYNFESEVINQTKMQKTFDKIVNGKYSAQYVNKLIGTKK
jgi:hypothetical protein